MDALIFSQYAIFTLLIVLMLLPMRYAYFALLLLSLFDASGSKLASASEVGFVNTLKIVAAPLIILIRLKFVPLRILFYLRRKRAFYVFLLLILYAGLAILWSEWKLSGVKLIGYLLGHLFWFAVIAHGWLFGHINQKMIGRFLITAVVLGVVQSYVMEPAFGVYQFEGQRFTAFLTTQYYAALLVFVTSVLVFLRGGFLIVIPLLITMFVVIAMTGSRYSFLGLVCVAGCFLFAKLREARTYASVAFVVLVLTLIVFPIGLISLGYVPLGETLQSMRVGELQYLISGPENIGSLAWRLGMYEETVRQISTASFSQILFGHGTASGAEVALAAYPGNYKVESIDANRVIHNEFLRALYEWGLVGAALLILVIMFILVSSIKSMINRKLITGYALFAVMPMFLLSLTIENVLASAGSGWGVGFILVLGAAYAEWQKMGGQG